MMTWSGNVFAVCGPDFIPPVWRFCEGYRAGAQYINPGIFVETIYYPGDASTAFVDEAWGFDMATDYYHKGFDVMFVAAGQTGMGALNGFASADNGSHPVYGLGVDYDYYSSSRGDVRTILLSSALRRTDQAAYDLIGLAVEERFPAGSFMGQIGYAPYHDLDIRVPDDVRQRMEEIARGLNRGTLQTGVPEAKP